MEKTTPETDIRPLMPHQPPMLLVNRVITAGEDGGEAEALFADGSLFALPDGRVDEAVHFELVAQAFAACTAARKAQAGEKPGPETGYLTSLRSLTVHGDAYTERAVRVRVRLAGRVEDFFIIEGEVSQDGRPLASCQVTILVPGGSTL